MVEQKITVSTEDILVRFGSVIALNNFSVNIPETVVGLLGPNGAGKTTFTRVILGLIKPERGEIRVAGIDPHIHPTKIRDMVGYMPEDQCLINNMNATQLVSYMGELSGLQKEAAKKRAHTVLDFVNLGEERYREISTYSTGMRQRVKLAQAIVHDPPLLLLDEPTNGMDPDGRREMLKLIQRIGASGKTVVVTSHILHEIQQLCEYIILLREGRNIAAGSIAELLQGKGGKYRITVRNGKIKDFISELEELFVLESKENKRGEYSLIVNGIQESKNIFSLANQYNVQIRSFRVQRPILEDIFVHEVEQSFQGEGEL